jgi:hypothetical protein
MTGQHGRHQGLWESIVDFAADHGTATCHDAYCPGSVAMRTEVARIFDTPASGAEVERELFTWLVRQWADTVMLTARTTANDTGGSVAFGLTVDSPTKAIVAGLFKAAVLKDDNERDALLDRALGGAASVDEMAFVILHGLIAALIERHRQLGSIGAHP